MSKAAEVKSAPKISAIWFIPIIAIAVGVWMLLQYQLSKGQTIYITMPEAEGIVAGKTEIKVRSVKIGTIDAVRLSEDTKHVRVRAQIDKHYDDLLTEDAKIWVVKPRIDETGISGLNTLLSGVYLEFAPGESKRKTNDFKLQQEPALIASDVAGSRFELLSRDTEVLEIGTRLYYRGYEVGQVESASFDWKQQVMRYKIFVNAPYENLISLNTLFWINSGIEVDLSADGINVKTGSISKMLKGGVSLGLPDDESAGPLAKEGHIFTLSDSYKTALEQRFFDFQHYLIYFEQSIRGLREGAPVEYRGMRIGTVAQAPAKIMIDGEPAHFSSKNNAVPVLIRVEFGRLYKNHEQAREFWFDNLDKWLSQGLRASLKPGNLLTGAVYVDFDIYGDAPTAQLSKHGDFTVFPSTSSGISAIANQVNDVLNKVKNLRVEESLAEFESTMSSYGKLAKDMQAFINDPHLRELPAGFNADMKDISQSMRQFEQSMEQFEITMASFQQGSQMYQQLNETLQQMQRLMDELQPLSRGLNEQPNMLIFDKELPADPVPRSGQE